MADGLRRHDAAPTPPKTGTTGTPRKARYRPALFADYLPAQPLEAEPQQLARRHALRDELIRTLAALAFLGFAAALWWWA